MNPRANSQAMISIASCSVFTRCHWRDRRWIYEHNDYGPWAVYTTLSHILYRNSERFELCGSRTVWRYAQDANTEGSTAREEAFPEVWEKHMLDPESPARVTSLYGGHRTVTRGAPTLNRAAGRLQ